MEAPDFDATGGIVSVRCKDSDTQFDIHRSLLSEKVPQLGLDTNHKSVTVLQLDVPFLGFRHFVHWLYNGDLPELGGMNDHPNASWTEWDDFYSYMEIEELLAARAAGQELQCVEFIDAVMDGIITILQHPVLELDVIIESIVRHFASGSAGRQLIIDLLIYGKLSTQMADDSFGIGYKALETIGDQDFSKALAREALVAARIDDPGQIQNTDIWVLVASGFLEQKKQDDVLGTAGQPRALDPCKYHRHTELGLPCYKAERKTD